VVEQYRGTVVKTTGDGVLATFDGPGRAVRCAMAFGTAAAQMNIRLRAGLHIGEIELRGQDIGALPHQPGPLFTELMLVRSRLSPDWIGFGW
jgi:hypothetical protein